MDRHANAVSLEQFCIAQRNAFDPADWHARCHIDRKTVALAARYLSMTSWYGHDEELERIAAAAHVFLDISHGLHRESREIDFDLLHFSYAVRCGVAQARFGKGALPSDSSLGAVAAKIAFA